MSHFHRVNQYTQAEALQNTKQAADTQQKHKPILITQYHPYNPDLRKIVDKHWNIIQYSRDCGQLFQKPIVGYRRLPNLKDKLTNAKCTLIQNPKPEMPIKQIELCKKFLTCKYCLLLKKQEFTWNYNYTQKFACNIPPKGRITCKLHNVVYAIVCAKCQKQYCGETGRKVMSRMYEHLLSVEKPQPYRDTPVSRHFLGKNHSNST